MYLGALLYIMMFLVFSEASVIQYRKSRRCDDTITARRKKMPWLTIILFALSCCIFNWYCTSISNGFGGDRTNYLYSFNGYRSESLGTDFLFKVIKSLSGDIYTVFYFTTFVCCAITFLAYRLSEDADARTIIFLLSTNFIIFTFTGLKQCYACAFSALFFSIIFRERTLKNDIICIVLIILACAFHSTGFVLIPVFLFCRLFGNNNRQKIFWIISLFTVAVFLQPLVLFVANLVKTVFPSLSAKITQYFAAENGYGKNGFNITAILGFPYYFLILWGVLLRKKIIKCEPHYDEYLILSGIGAGLYALSAAIYWMQRFTSNFFMPMGILFSYIMKYSIKNNRLIIGLAIVGITLFLTLRQFFQVYTLLGGF